MNILATFEKVIIANELDGSLAHTYKFSDPDGVRSGKSGWSFGSSQFDINNNPTAILCLRDCGFSALDGAELAGSTMTLESQRSNFRSAAEAAAKERAGAVEAGS